MKLYHLSVYWGEYEDRGEEYIGAFSSKKIRERARIRFWEECQSNLSRPFEDVREWYKRATNENEWMKIHHPRYAVEKIEIFGEWETELDQISFIDPPPESE